MASPPSVTIKNLTGKFVMNKSISDDFDPVLALQGVNWVTRTALSLATVTLDVKQYDDDAGVTHVDIQQTATGGIKGTAELRTLDWEPRLHDDHIFGKLQGKSRWIDTADLEDPFQKEGWLDGEEEKGGPKGELHMENQADAEAGWTANQVWGFALIDGVRYYTRRIVVKKGDQVLKVRLVYNYKGQ